MATTPISNGAVHQTPTDMRRVFADTVKMHKVWEDITPLARNEWICWITSAKKNETRDRRVRIMIDKLSRGDRRPCCWSGCTHR